MGFNNLRYVPGVYTITFYWDSISTGVWFPNTVNIYIWRDNAWRWVKNTGGWPGTGPGSATVTATEGQYSPGEPRQFRFTVWDCADKDATTVWGMSLPYPTVSGSVSATGVGQVSISFSKSTNGTWYLDIERNGVTKTYSSPSSPVTQTGLGNGNTYTYRIRVRDSVGPSSWVNLGSVTTFNIPSAPSAPTLTLGGSADTATLKVAWSAPSNGGTAITGYKLYYSTNGGSTWSNLSPGNVTSYTFTNAAKGTAYLVKVAAINMVGEGAQSAQASATTWNYPGKVTISSVTPYTQDGKHYLLVLFYVNDTGGTTLSKQILYRNINGSASTLDLSGSVASYQQLTPYRGELYKFQISAVNVIGEGTKSDEVWEISRGDNHSTTSTASFGGGGAYF